jgi:hypothetical protein
MTKNIKTAAVHEMGFVHTDGGRMQTKRFKRQYAGDCVTRAITLAEDINYILVYKELSRRMKAWGRSGANNGVYDSIWRPMLKDAGYEQVMPRGASATIVVNAYTRMQTVPLASAELPTKGTVVCRVRRARGGRHGHHLFTIIDGVIHDSFNPANPAYNYELMEYHIKPRRSTLVGQIRGADKPAKPKKERKVTKIEGNGEYIKVGKAWREIDPDGFKAWGKEAGTWSRAAAGAYLQETDPDQYASLLAR